jgi:hypothetical protein
MEKKQSSSYLLNKFLKIVNKELYDFYTNDLPDDFEYIDYLVKDYMKKGMKLKNKLDKILFQAAEYVYIYIVLIKNGYIFKNKVALVFFFLKLSEKMPDDINETYSDPRKKECKYILKNEEVQKYINLGEIIITDKDIDDYVKLSENTESENFIIYLIINDKFKENKNIVWPKIIFKLNKYMEIDNKVRKQIEEYNNKYLSKNKDIIV